MSDLEMHSRESSFREKLIEHMFVAELLKYSWRRTRQQGGSLIEVSRADVDRGGYDLIAEVGRCLRHIQIKGSALGATTSRLNVHVALSDKPSGCVVWIYLNEEDWSLDPSCTLVQSQDNRCRPSAGKSHGTPRATRRGRRKTAPINEWSTRAGSKGSTPLSISGRQCSAPRERRKECVS